MLLTPGKHVNVAWLDLARNRVLPALWPIPATLIAGTLHRGRDVTTVVETISISTTDYEVNPRAYRPARRWIG